MTACIMAGSFTPDPLVYPALRKIMLPMKHLSGGEIRGVQEPSSSVSALHHHHPYEVKGRGRSPTGEFVGTRTPPNRIYRRRIPPEIFDALPESAVDPPISGDDDHEGVNFRLSKGDHWRHGDGTLSPVAKPLAPTYGRAITVTGSPIKKSEKTYFGEQDLSSAHAIEDPYKNQQSGASDVRSSSPNTASQILRCQQCLGGTVFGVYQTPTASRKTSQGATTYSAKEGLRKTSVPSSASSVPHSTTQQVPLDQRRRESVPERRYKPVYYSDPRYRHRFERFNYGYNDVNRPSSREIAVSGLQEFCRTMLTVKNCPVDYHHQEKHLTHSSLDCAPNQVNTSGGRGYYDYDGTASPRRDTCNVKQAAQEKNETLRQNTTRAELQKQEQVGPSPTLRSPKLVKEILKRMSSQPSGQILQSTLGNYSDDDENFVHGGNESEKPDPEAMRIMDEFDKALGAEDKPLDQDCHSPEMIHSKNESSPQPQSKNTKKVKKEQESQSDNLIEEFVLSGHKVEQPMDKNCAVSPGEHENEVEVTVTSSETDAPEKQEIQKRVESPAPQKPPRNYDSLTRGFKLSSGESSLDQVSSGHQPLNNESLDVAVHPTSTSADSGVYSPQQNYFVVVAIDFGTTYSGYAFSFTRDPENIHMMRRWEGGDQDLQNQKIPTSLLLTPDEKFYAFGYAARDCYHDLEPEDAKKWLYFEKFKMILHTQVNLNRDTCIAAANGRNLPAVTVFAHALRYFKDHTLQELSDQSATEILNEDIRWVVTVPAIWRQPAKQFMRSAAYEAGIASADAPEQLMIALEPEAASIFCRRLQTHQLVPSVTSPQRLSLPNVKNPENNSEPAVVENTGTRYMVVDCGGGTVDITVHEIVDDHGTIKELHKATGGPHGSIGIDMEFEKVLNDIFGADFMEQFKIKRPVGFIELMNAFESRKRSASQFKITPFNISLPYLFVEHYTKTKRNSVENAIKKYGNKELKSCRGMLRLEPTFMQRLFQPTLDAIKQHIEAVLNHPQVKNLQYLFLVGGFAGSPILQKCIRDAFSSQLRVIIPQGVSLAILKGAVQFGLDPTVITARRSRLTYGVGVLNRFVHGTHPKEKLVVKDGIEWCADIFDKFVVSDQSVCVGDMVIRKYTPARVGQACSVIHIYCSEKEDVNFITDPGVQRCGTLILDLSDSSTYDSSSSRREIETVMIFGDTELKVSAVDVTTGKCVRAEVDFFNQ